MLPDLMLPASWRALLETFRPAFARAPTFGLFMLLATGLVAQTSRRTVVGMLAGAGMATVVSFHSVCRFFSHHRWAPDQLGLLLARLIVTRLLAEDAPLVIAVDDTLFRRWGRRVHAAFWTHDGAAQGPAKLGRGNRWIIAGLVVALPFCSHPVCLPVLCRLWAGKGTTTPVELAGQLLGLLAAAFPDRKVHGVGDAAYHGRSLLVPPPASPPDCRATPRCSTWPRRALANAVGPGSRAASWGAPPSWPPPRAGARRGYAATGALRPYCSPSCPACGTARSPTPPAG
jgi:hypothetical protein